MRRLWIRIRIPLAVIVLLVITLALARLFSGPEDSWIKNEAGEWVKHGHPAGPAPAQDYREPVTHLVVPLVFLVSFAVPLFFFGKHKPRNRLNFDTATRDLRYYGYLGTALFLLGVLTVAGLTLELVLSGTGCGTGALAEGETLLIIGSLLGFAGLCIVIAVLLFMLKRIGNDHYRLEKSLREIIGILEKSSSA